MKATARIAPLLLSMLAMQCSVVAADPGQDGASPSAGPRDVEDKWQSDPAVAVDSATDSSETQMMAAGAGAAAAMGNHGKFFQYGHHDGKDHYEFGFRRGNEHHFQERHEKAAPKHGHFTTKVRWGDKHGGYGEHYWDYNHAGHDDGGDGGGEGSAPVPEYSASSPESEKNRERDDPRSQFKRQSEQQYEPNPRTYRNKYVRGGGGGGGARKTIPTGAASAPVPQPASRRPAGSKSAAYGAEQLHQEDFATRTARQIAHKQGSQGKPAQPALRRLVLNTQTGLVHDEDTGTVYALQPVS